MQQITHLKNEMKPEVTKLMQNQVKSSKVLTQKVELLQKLQAQLKELKSKTSVGGGVSSKVEQLMHERSIL
jgi:uncharacterized protein Yka (UPF0111/DUF47 family)